MPGSNGKNVDEYDLSTYNIAMEEYKKDSTSYTLSEVEKELGLGKNKLNQ